MKNIKPTAKKTTKNGTDSSTLKFMEGRRKSQQQRRIIDTTADAFSPRRQTTDPRVTSQKSVFASEAEKKKAEKKTTLTKTKQHLLSPGPETQRRHVTSTGR